MPTRSASLRQPHLATPATTPQPHDTLARVATALDRHLIVSLPEKVPAKLEDAVQVA